VNAEERQRRVADRNARYARELEDFLRTWTLDGYAGRAASAWHRDYASTDAYQKSVETNRQRWRDVLSPPELSLAGEVRCESFETSTGATGCWLGVPLQGGDGFGRLRAEAAFAMPDRGAGPFPLVITQHGIGSSPERTFGLNDESNVYKHYASALLSAGFAVLAPFNLAGVENRNRVERMASLGGTTLPGIELVRLQRLLDVVLVRKEIDAERVGMWGISLGGMATQFWTPLEPRITVAISCAWFNSRIEKMIVPDPRYSCFLDTKEEHAFFRNWLATFDEADLCSLICPRPFLIQTGKADAIAWWPKVVATFEVLKAHYERLSVSDRLAMDLHEGGHEIRVESGLAWLTRWLKPDDL
jgi:dienelactone hydrolase